MTLEIESSNLDIICIAETWFKEESCPNINGYNLFRNDRVGTTGGGVCIYVKSHLKSYNFDFDFNLSLPGTVVEAVWCLVECGEETILVGCIYRPGDSSHSENEKINSQMIKVKKLYLTKKIFGFLITGDFNFNWIGQTVLIKSLVLALNLRKL